MKDKVLFIGSLIGVFSPTVLVFVTELLTILGVDTSGYAQIIDLASVGLAGVILILATIFLNRYTNYQQKQTTAQNTAVTTALDTNAGLLQTLLPDLATKIMTAAEDRGTQLLQATETKVNTMMNEMLPTLAEQTMELVTQKSQNIVEETTTKVNDAMTLMNELIPTFSKAISDNVAQIVRENNAHYYKMLTDLKKVVDELVSKQ